MKDNKQSDIMTLEKEIPDVVKTKRKGGFSYLGPLADVVKDGAYSLGFFLKAVKRNVLGLGDYKTITTDLDNTIVAANTLVEVLVDKFGKEEALRIDNEWHEARRNGLSGNKLLHFTHQLRIDYGVTEKDWRRTFKRLVDEDRINHKFVEFIRELRENGKRKVFIVTKSSSVIAELFSEMFGFDGGFGTIVNDDKRKIESLMGQENGMVNGTPVTTKLKVVEYHMSEKGQAFVLGENIHCADDHFDRNEMFKSGYSILVPNENGLTPVQNRLLRWGHFDTVSGNDDQSMFRLFNAIVNRSAKEARDHNKRVRSNGLNQNGHNSNGHKAKN